MAVGAEGQAIDGSRVAAELEPLAALRVPDPDEPVLPRGDEVSVRVERDRANAIRMAAEDEPFLPCRDVPGGLFERRWFRRPRLVDRP